MSNHDRDAFPNTPRNLRMDAGMKSKEVAELMGYTPSGMSRFERQRTNPTAATLARFFAAVGRDDLANLMLVHLSQADCSSVHDVRRARAAWLAGRSTPA